MASRIRFQRFSCAVLVCFAGLGCDGAEEARSASIDGQVGCLGVAGETVRWIVAGSPGGGVDVGSRLIAPFFETAIGAQIAVENRAGAGGRLGARIVRDAEPDGRTLGIVSGTALLLAGLSEDLQGLHPLNDFTVLGRIASEDPVWLRGPSSRFRTWEDVMARPAGEPIVFGITDVGGTSFGFASLPAELLRVELTYLPGYMGSPEVLLGLIRGEFDLTASSFESTQDRIDAGEVTPILQISDRPFADHPALAGVPVLGGPQGVAARVARERGEDPQAATQRAEALDRLFRIGRLIVGPPGLAVEQAACLSARLAEAVREPAFLAAAARARRTINFSGPAALAAEFQVTEGELSSMAFVVRRYLESVRGVAPTP